MKRVMAVTVAMALAFASGAAWAEGKVTVTREANRPGTIEVTVGEEVWFVNGSGGVAHVSFGDSPIQFMVGSANSKIRFAEAGTYTYYVHISGVKAHAHTGTVIVK